ncbi:hypothetical protein OZN62_11570 [Aurantiacibacter sp. MUD11]|uniref:hypothetical protein n=1 Tax=Aurantiacibacter sp. MUD11 TaxID=3003265 RepID=UPI0022AA3E28|nr:hypothetical protein [Aurantiacibacter sp. MUD11]WAT17551.1 hypothetical protein OZN62_11570 [Aurantiacibacter sp. MUD11]
MTTLSRSLILGVSVMTLAACGADEIVSPGTGGNVTINNVTNNPAPTPTPSPTPTATLVTPANGCPTIADPQGLTDEGTITGPEGEWRVCATPDRFNVSSTLPRVDGLLYRLPGQVNVGTDGGPADVGADTDVELTIEPGVIIYASGSSFLNVNRGNSIDANGTASMPIIFTSRDNILGLNNENSSGQWGGVVLSGRAPVTDCFQPAAVPGTVDCERQVEGAAAPTFFGGATNDDSSGSLSYVQIRYSGFVLSGDNELQSLTTGGTGTGTSMSYIQSVNSSDDGVEFFGGFVNLDHLIVAGAEDDSLDTDTGVKANLQYVLVAQRDGIGDAIIEADSNNGLEDQTPRQNTQVSNFTFIQRKTDDQVVRIRGGADYGLSNGVIFDATGATPCIRIDLDETIRAANAGLDDVGPPTFNSVALDCTTNFRDGSGGVTAAQAEAIFDAGTGNDKAYTHSIVNGYLNGANEDGYAPIFDATALSSFFDTVTFIGAVSAADDWTQGWTCDSAALTFGNNTGSCLGIPVF